MNDKVIYPIGRILVIVMIADLCRKFINPLVFREVIQPFQIMDGIDVILLVLVLIYLRKYNLMTGNKRKKS